ncbi:MAG TPA: DUF86 domain-containing protein, partial [Nitrospiraceae bacterium]|nr:DUF86 domain-containing protein [Nitrospiraceae bacterium]
AVIFERLLVTEVNVDRLRELAGHLRSACRQLQEHASLGVDGFLSDTKTTNSAKYLFIVACEAALDICNHLAAKRGGRSPEDYADCMAILGELGILDPDLQTRMSRMARFRNLLVHLYWRVDDREVFRVMSEHLDDFDRYLRAIGQYLKAEL